MKNKIILAFSGLLISAQILSTPAVTVLAVEKPVVVQIENEENSESSDDNNENDEINNVNETYGDIAKESEIPETYEFITISNIDELISFSKNASYDIWSKDKYVTLTSDISVAGSDFKYIPIFAGVFDGNGHTISGIEMRKGESYTGLFCITQASATIKNLNVSGYFCPDGKQLATGGIVGDNFGKVIDCSFDGTVEGYDYSGGIAGYNEITGQIIGCESNGTISGMHCTGGIAGENYGLIRNCKNISGVNTFEIKEKFSIEDINIEQYTSILKDYTGESSKDSTSVVNSPVDAGGICGRSAGVIEMCTNVGSVGYEHIGYNIGGIVGRQSGHLKKCKNYATILGRKDVGGIVGQAEPYVVLDLSNDIVSQLSQNIEKLHGLLDVTLTDAGSESNMVSGRLNVVKQFTDLALNDTNYLSQQTEIWINGMVSAGNEILDRADYIMDETAKEGGIIDQGKNAGTNVKKASENLTYAIDDLKLEQYLNESEKADYNQAKSNMEQASKDYDEAYNLVKGNFDNYKKEYYLQYIAINHKTDIYYGSGSNLYMYKDGKLPFSGIARDDYKDYIDYSVKHIDTDDTVLSDFPASESIDGKNVDKDTDAKLNTAATKYADEKAGNDIESEANAEFLKYGYSDDYKDYMKKQSELIINLYIKYYEDIEGNSSEDAKKALQNVKDASANLESAGGQTKNILTTLNNKPDVNMPSLPPEYQQRTSSLVANIQGMSDNLGYLNNDMNSANQNLISDMKDVNDQFNVIMMLFTDAVDGVLEMDYSTVYEDYSRSVAEECTEGTVADCNNYGAVKGDIDVAGIAGTMAIEYDFDLESDVTGIDNPKINATYQTKCVLRNNRNDGDVCAQKNYAGGVTGLQEMGTILRNSSFGKIESNTADYVGGVAGQSLATIINSCSKGIFKGRKYVGGIAGFGNDINASYSLPTIEKADGFYGAIAGDLEEDAVISNNYFCSEDVAGVNRISFAGKAEPISFSDLNIIENIPSDFKELRVIFVLDDETVEIRNVKYESNLYKDSFPEAISAEDDMYADWDIDELKHIVSDVEVTGKSQRYVTTLAGEKLRDNMQSAVLVDGMFTASDSLYSEVTEIDNKNGKNEIWMLGIPQDGLTDHLIRYQMPEDVSEVEIEVVSGDKSSIAKTTQMGKYLTFQVKGQNVKFMVHNKSKNIFEKYWYYFAAGAAVIVLLILIIAVNIKKKSVAKKHQKEKSSSEKKEELKIEELDEIE